METIKDKLQNIFRDIFSDGTLVLTEDLSINDINGWDSLSNISLVLAIEKEFNIKFNFADLQNMNNVGCIIKCIATKLDKS